MKQTIRVRVEATQDQRNAAAAKKTLKNKRKLRRVVLISISIGEGIAENGRRRDALRRVVAQHGLEQLLGLGGQHARLSAGLRLLLVRGPKDGVVSVDQLGVPPVVHRGATERRHCATRVTKIKHWNDA